MLERMSPPAPVLIETRVFSKKRMARIFACAVCLAGGVPASAEARTSELQATSLSEPPAESFVTRHAGFQSTAFDQIPGWRSDNLLASYRGLRQSCNALASKPAWSRPCAEMAMVATNSEAIRLFFERNFVAYQVVSPEPRADGMVTGYFEPELEGRRERSDTFRYPVYGPPRDLLLLDARSLTGEERQWFVISEGNLRASSAGAPAARAYAVMLATRQPDNRDQRFRVRIDGDRILPYFTRQEIEQRPMDAPILAWVDDPLQLYAIQVQGIGRIRMDDGRVLRLGASEHNGQSALSRREANDVLFAGNSPRTRGLGKAPARLSDELLAQVIANLDAAPERSPPRPPTQRARATTGPAKAPAARQTGATSAIRESSVDDIVAALAAQRNSGKPPNTPAGSNSERQRVSTVAATQGGETASTVAPSTTPEQPGPPILSMDGQATDPYTPASYSTSTAVTRIPDSGYVFFNSVDDDSPHTVGTLGVPLTAGRSLAADPRTTPLGSPVFVSTREPGSETPMQRLMFVQDTTVASNGGIGGDIFWGAGETAGRLAQATRDSARMWLLLPRDQALAMMSQPASGASGSALRNCVVVDPDFCVEE